MNIIFEDLVNGLSKSKTDNETFYNFAELRKVLETTDSINMLASDYLIVPFASFDSNNCREYKSNRWDK